MDRFIERLKTQLKLHRQAGLYRQPPEIFRREGASLLLAEGRVLNFASNDYLGLGVSEVLRKQVARNFEKYGSSSSSSRLVSGNYSLIAAAERAYARYFGYEEALFFPSGYQANLALLSTLFDSGTVIFFDKHIHASSVKGLALSPAQLAGYNHSSLAHLRKRLERGGEKETVVLTESLFSMDGDLLDVSGLAELKDRYGFLCIVDEAHALGVLGERGCGVARPVADIAVGTFGKALGLFGAFLLLPAIVKEYLFNFASPLIYSTTLPEAHAASAIDILALLAEGDESRRRLGEISLQMKTRLRSAGFTVQGDAHILALEIGNEQKALEASNRLREKGIFVLSARYPTVPLGKAILRIGMTALHSEEDVNVFIQSLKEVMEKI
ncbi:8-amino-7-oxononanoate synthase [Syntrophus gentianae]|uniref:8-amino-7-oxononanoate synthase n=1 Tax=Syntrophus gentianae TaxID=43775 RepID=A0A1H7UGJ5_9BACT|nr:pyridoxal phosphate-dependent aminotransferase family protein [Syntrophus gentianae]SEL96153.1 8-amino-7-oxononanoate synthase [Syntrophus gentianae]